MSERECKKCNTKKSIESFCDTINSSKGYECKDCRSVYIKAYYSLNKERIRNNERIRRNRAKNSK